MEKNIKSALFGVAVGDALGVPVEFKSRAAIAMNPITDMTGDDTKKSAKGLIRIERENDTFVLYQEQTWKQLEKE